VTVNSFLRCWHNRLNVFCRDHQFSAAHSAINRVSKRQPAASSLASVEKKPVNMSSDSEKLQARAQEEALQLLVPLPPLAVPIFLCPTSMFLAFSIQASHSSRTALSIYC